MKQCCERWMVEGCLVLRSDALVPKGWVVAIVLF